MLSKEIIGTIRSYQETLRSQANKGFEARLASGLAREMANTFDLLLGETGNAKPAQKPEVTLVRSDDWEGLYIDGKLAVEASSIQYREFAAKADVNLKEVWANEDWLIDLGNFPENIKDVKVAKR